LLTPLTRLIHHHELLRTSSPPPSTASPNSTLSSPSLSQANCQSRTYATSVKGAKPPVTIHTLEGTYASALYSATANNNATLNEIEKSLQKIRTKLVSDTPLQQVVVNPALSAPQKADVIKLLTMVGGGGGEATKAVENLLGVLSENGRLGQLDGVVAAFERIMRAHKGEVEVIVTSAQSLDAKTLQRLEQAISRSTLIRKGQKVRMENKVPGMETWLTTGERDYPGWACR
jgi:F-type H+-transporting ATPase subunit O